jgi:flavin-dependent thymidylate synthase
VKVVLAGYNVDAGILSRSRAREGEGVTPEVLSAAYARISRDPRSVGSLRAEALREVEKARRSNERIVFGLGHASVAEHAVLNFDVTGISRLAVEEIERFRLASFTEKSQRYIRLGRDLVVPPEIRGTTDEKTFRALVKELHERYEETFGRLSAAGVEAGSAKEDARYLMPLATATQFGMTMNARELEYAIMRLAAHPLGELRSLSRGLYRASKSVVPSLIRYPRPTEHWRDMPGAKREIAAMSRVRRRARGTGGLVELAAASPDPERRLVSCILYAASGRSLADCEIAARALSGRSVARIIRTSMRSMGPHDAAWREFECVALVFDLVVSASCYAQLKRHRMATIVPQAYDLSLGVSVPDTVKRAGAAGLLRAGTASAGRYFRSRAGSLGMAAQYALTNAHRRRVLFACNLRELYHFSRLRGDMSAQWEIRELSEEMCRVAAREMPAAAALLGGKDVFVERKKRFEAEK